VEANLSVTSDQLNKEDVRALLQAIRDCENVNFPDKEIFISCEVPEMNVEDLRNILDSIRPPFDFRSLITRKP